MPIYEYQAITPVKGCNLCKKVFSITQKIHDAPLTKCPACGQTIKKLVSLPSIGSSKSSFDARAKNAGFHKFKKLGKGEYERKY